MTLDELHNDPRYGVTVRLRVSGVEVDSRFVSFDATREDSFDYGTGMKFTLSGTGAKHDDGSTQSVTLDVWGDGSTEPGYSTFRRFYDFYDLTAHILYTIYVRFTGIITEQWVSGQGWDYQIVPYDQIKRDYGLGAASADGTHNRATFSRPQEYLWSQCQVAHKVGYIGEYVFCVHFRTDLPLYNNDESGILLRGTKADTQTLLADAQYW